jgi:hypothetical protein
MRTITTYGISILCNSNITYQVIVLFKISYCLAKICFSKKKFRLVQIGSERNENFSKKQKLEYNLNWKSQINWIECCRKWSQIRKFKNFITFIQTRKRDKYKCKLINVKKSKFKVKLKQSFWLKAKLITFSRLIWPEDNSCF